MLACIASWPYHITQAGQGSAGMGMALRPWPGAKRSCAPRKVCVDAAGPARCTGVQCRSPAWDTGHFWARPWLLQPGLYPLLDAFLPASGEERGERAAFCSLKVICQLQREEKLCCESPWPGWGTHRVAGVQDSNANQCCNSLLEDQSSLLCFLGFFPLPLRFS